MKIITRKDESGNPVEIVQAVNKETGKTEHFLLNDLPEDSIKQIKALTTHAKRNPDEYDRFGRPKKLEFSGNIENKTGRAKAAAAMSRRRKQREADDKRNLELTTTLELMNENGYTADQALDIVEGYKKQAKDTNSLMAALIGFNKWGQDMKSGAKDLMGIEGEEERKKQRQYGNRVYNFLEGEHPNATTIGNDILPIATTLPIGFSTAPVRLGLQGTKLGTALQTGELAAKNAAIGGLEGGINPYDTATSGALWGGSTSAGTKILNDLLSAPKGKINEEEKEIINFAKEEDLFIPPGMYTGNIMQKGLDRQYAQTAGTQEVYRNKVRDSSEKQNLLISKELPEQTELFTDSYLDRTTKTIQDNMDEIASKSSFDVDESLYGELENIGETYKANSLDQMTAPVINRHIDRAYRLLGSDVSGENFQKWNRELSQHINSAYKKDPALGDALKNIQDTLFERAGNKSEWKKANRQYALTKSIEKSLLSDTDKFAGGVSGYVDPMTLSRNFKSSEDINNLAKYQRLFKSIPAQNLTTMNNINTTLFSGHPVNRMSALGGLIGRSTPFMPTNLMSSLYFSGYPTKTGFLGEKAHKFIDEKVAGPLGASTITLDTGQSEEEKEQEELLKYLMSEF